MLTKHAADAFYIVTNAGRRDRDLSWIREKLAEWNVSEKGKECPVDMEVMEGWGLLAIQGLFFFVCFGLVLLSHSGVVTQGLKQDLICRA
jgi:hypothetical protein